MAIAWLPGPAGTRRRVAKLSVEEPDAADSTRIQTQSWTSCGVEIETRVQDNQADSGWMCATPHGKACIAGHPTVRDRRGALGDVTHGEPRNPTRKSKERLWSLLAYRCARPGSIPWICGGPGSATTLVYPTSMSSQVRSRISCLRQPAARRVRRRWWGRRFPTRAVRRGPDERRVGGRCQGRGPCEAWLGVHRRAVMPRTSFSTPRHVPSETLECHRSWPAM